MSWRGCLALAAIALAAACAGDENPAEPAPEVEGAETTAAAEANVEPSAVPSLRMDPPYGPPDALVDLMSAEGAASLSAEWRYHDVRIVNIESPGPGPDRRASGPPVQTNDYEPKAGPADFDDSAWPVISPESLEERRGGGRLSFGWYRTKLRLPDEVGGVPIDGATVAFEIVVDDYAEVWVNGELQFELGQSGGSVARGFNSPNRVILTRSASAGDEFQLAVFGINGPISVTPSNFIWVRAATLEIFRDAEPTQRGRRFGHVERLEAALDALISPTAEIAHLASGFAFTEGPVWRQGALVFSDPNMNTIYRYHPDGNVSVFRAKSGYRGMDIGDYHQPGSNGLALDPEGRLVICEHGNRRVTRLERNGSITVLADRHEGRRLNSPNDVIVAPDGTVYFTDPPFGLPRAFDDPSKELDFSGVFRIRDGALELMSRELAAPNGLALSPDGRFLYVDNWELDRKIVLRFEVVEGGGLGEPEEFHDFIDAGGDPDLALDGLKVDAQGNVYVAGPLGIHILSSDGQPLGVIHVVEQPANFAFGGEDGLDLYMTARTGLYRVRLNVPGAGRQ